MDSQLLQPALARIPEAMVMEELMSLVCDEFRRIGADEFRAERPDLT